MGNKEEGQRLMDATSDQMIIWASSLEVCLEWFFKKRKKTISGVSEKTAEKLSAFEQFLLLLDILENEEAGDDLPDTLLEEMTELAEEIMTKENGNDYSPIEGFKTGPDMKRYPQGPYKLIIPE